MCKSLSQVLIVLLTTLTATSASAVFISVETSQSFNGAAPDVDGPHTATTGELYAGVSNNAVALASDAGVIQANAVVKAPLSTVTSWDLSARTIWSDTITNSTNISQTYTFDFIVHPGMLGVSNDSISTDSGYSIDITADSTSLFSSVANLSSINGLTSTGTDLGATLTVDTGGMFSEYGWGKYNDSVMFSVAPLSSVTLTYDMQAYTFGSAQQCSLTFAGFVFCNSKALIGDPFEISTGSIQAVPIPAALWMFGSGLIGLFGLANYREHDCRKNKQGRFWG